MPPRQPPVVVSSQPRTDGALSVVDVREHECTLSTGEVLFIRYEKLRALAESICQEQSAIEPPRIWWTKDAGNELIELRRESHGAPSISKPTDDTLKTASEVL